jgi:hypothetical protein
MEPQAVLDTIGLGNAYVTSCTIRVDFPIASQA